MKTKEMKILINHCDLHFEQNDCLVLHSESVNELHIDVLLYKPTDKYPFWKLVTMGASDYKMPSIQNTIGLYNEYIMFVDADVDLTDEEVVKWYHNKLMLVASFAYINKTHITYGHSFEWENEDANDEMIAAFIEFPQIIETTDVLRCKMGLFKTVTCLQVVLLNKCELDKLMEIGPEDFSYFLYPNDDTRPHFLSEQQRSEKF